MNLRPSNTRIMLCVLVHNFSASKESKYPSSWPQALIPSSDRNQSLTVFLCQDGKQPTVMVFSGVFCDLLSHPWIYKSVVLLVCGNSRTLPTDWTPTEHLLGLFMLWGGIFPSFPLLTVSLSDLKYFGVVDCCLRWATASLAIQLHPPLASCRCWRREHHQQCRNAAA